MSFRLLDLEVIHENEKKKETKKKEEKQGEKENMINHFRVNKFVKKEKEE